MAAGGEVEGPEGQPPETLAAPERQQPHVRGRPRPVSRENSRGESPRVEKFDGLPLSGGNFNPSNARFGLGPDSPILWISRELGRKRLREEHLQAAVLRFADDKAAFFSAFSSGYRKLVVRDSQSTCKTSNCCIVCSVCFGCDMLSVA